MAPPSICVFCGSSQNVSPMFINLARDVGALLAKRKVRVIYGGARNGMMGALADGALAAGGTIIGVLPVTLRDRELAHPGLTEMHIVDSMYERKERMDAMSDAFLALPGGFGTLDELFEMVTTRQLGYHEKRVALINGDGFYHGLLAWMRRAVHERFIPESLRNAIEVVPDLAALDAWVASLQKP